MYKPCIVRRFQFNNQLFAVNRTTDASFICGGAFSTSESQSYTLSISSIVLISTISF